jgi:hypothetical protein
VIDKFYLVDVGYGAKLEFLPPFRGVRYHLNEWGNNPIQNEKKLFNHRHSSLRVTEEHAFGSLKRKFKILDDAIPFFPFPTQVEIVLASCIIHNWVIEGRVMSSLYLRMRSCLVLLIKHQYMGKLQTMPLWLTLVKKLPMPCGKTVNTIIIEIMHEPMYFIFEWTNVLYIHRNL